MARTYWIRGRTSVTEGDSLDAHTARKLMQGNVESVFESALDQSICILPAAQTGNAAWFSGPHPVLARCDRDGRYRKLSVAPLCSGGTSGSTLRATLTPLYYPPSSTDLELEFTIASGTVVSWRTAQAFTPPAGWVPAYHPFSLGDDPGVVRLCWLMFEWSSLSGATAPKFAGFRVIEALQTVE